MKDDLLTEVGQRIRERRKASGMSQEDFARLAGIERSFYGKLERGDRNMSLEVLGRIALALRVELGELLAGLPELPSD